VRALLDNLRRIEDNSMMNSRLRIALPAACCLLGFAGCGNPPGLYPVTGKVLWKGEPASGAVVYFHPEGSGPVTTPAIPSGLVDDDGSFYLTVDNLGNGCPPGKYAVLVEWRDRSGDGVVTVGKGKSTVRKRSKVRSGPDRLKGRYLDIKKPLLHAEVLAQSNPLPPFRLDD
jgi:hypothetical protein